MPPNPRIKKTTWPFNLSRGHHRGRMSRDRPTQVRQHRPVARLCVHLRHHVWQRRSVRTPSFPVTAYSSPSRKTTSAGPFTSGLLLCPEGDPVATVVTFPRLYTFTMLAVLPRIRPSHSYRNLQLWAYLYLAIRSARTRESYIEVSVRSVP
jgi:hypothetical protein